MEKILAMKITKLPLLFLLSIVLFSCSEDDSEGGTTPVEPDNFFPLVTGNSWNYENVASFPDQDDIVSNETLSVVDSTTVGTTVNYDLATDNPQNASAVTLALSQGDVSKTDESLIVSGNLGFGFEGFPGINIAVENAAMYDTNATPNTQLFTDNGTIEQDFQGAPLTINYDVEILTGSNLDSYTVNGTTYSDVVSSQIKITLEVQVTIFVPITILPSQEAVVIDNYFAKDIGLIYSETNTNLDFVELDQLPIPLEDFSFIGTQSIESYNVDLE